MDKKTLDQLTPFHRAKVIERARVWRLANHAKILETLKGFHHEKPCPPVGVKMFSPEHWDAQNWVWFREILLADIYRRMR